MAVTITAIRTTPRWLNRDGLGTLRRTISHPCTRCSSWQRRRGLRSYLANVMKILFLHGWQSVPGGVKPTFLAQHGHEVINPPLPDEDFGEAVKIAQAKFDKHRPQVVVGSSRGGAVAMNINSGDARLVLLCPAWKKWGTARTVKPGTVILHSTGRRRGAVCRQRGTGPQQRPDRHGTGRSRRRPPAGRPGATAKDAGGVRGGGRRPHPMTDRIIAIGDIHGCVRRWRR